MIIYQEIPGFLGDSFSSPLLPPKRGLLTSIFWSQNRFWLWFLHGRNTVALESQREGLFFNNKGRFHHAWAINHNWDLCGDRAICMVVWTSSIVAVIAQVWSLFSHEIQRTWLKSVITKIDLNQWCWRMETSLTPGPIHGKQGTRCELHSIFRSVIVVVF